MTTSTQTTHSTTSRIRRPITVAALLLITATVVWLATSSNMIGDLFNNASELSNAMTTWEEQEIDSYSYELQVSCFCFPDMTRRVNIVVSDGTVQSVAYVDDGEPADPSLFTAYSTVENLFERLENAQSDNPATFDVTFDEQYGVPQSVFVDIDERMADEEIMFTVSNFEALP